MEAHHTSRHSSKAHLKPHLCCEMLSASVMCMSRGIDVSGQRDSPGKCHNSRPMVDSAPDLRRVHLFSTRTLSLSFCGESHLGRSLEEATHELSPSVYDPGTLRSIDTIWSLYASYVDRHACGQCLLLSMHPSDHTNEAPAPGQEGDLPEACTTQYIHRGAYLRARTQLSK